jgi:hypothetical protein
MGNSNGNFFSSILKFFCSLFGSKPGGSTPPPNTQPDNTTEPVRVVTNRVFLIIYDPVVDAAGTKLSQAMHWNNADDLVNGFITDIQTVSGGNARYEVVQRQVMNEFPALEDGYRYDVNSLRAVLQGGQAHQPMYVNYTALLTGFSIIPRITAGEFDEVWLFGFPYAGFHESNMGGAGAFWCNADPIPGTAGCQRKFVVMGFNYERGVGEMLEAFAHRAESILAHCYNSLDFMRWTYNPQRVPPTVGTNLNAYQQFMSFDKISPGKAGVGNVHYCPNSDQDYDWNNPHPVASTCYDWYNYPGFVGDVRNVEASEWGNGDIRKRHQWWLKHLPRVAGRTGGVVNNWWQYAMDPNLAGT